MIYFDNSATTFIKPKEVKSAVLYALENFGSPNRSTYPVAINASRALHEARDSIGKFFNVNPSNVSFTSGSTESLNLILNALLEENDHVITSRLEHNSVLRPLYKLNVGISFLDMDEKGNILYDKLHTLINPNTKALIINHGSNVTGELADIKLLSDFCKENNIYFVVDISQTAGTIFVDGNLADFMAFTGHKSLFGPQGTGGIIAKSGLKVPTKVGGSGFNTFSKVHPIEMPDFFEAGTHNIHGIYGLKAGIEFIMNTGLQEITKKEERLVNLFVSEVSKIKKVKLYGDYSEKGCPVVSLLVDGYDATEISEFIWENGEIATRGGFHCAPLVHEFFGTSKTGMCRFSFSYFNTEDEVLKAVDVLKRM